MALDPSIFGLIGQGVRSVSDYDNAANQQKLNALTVLLHQQQLAQSQQDFADANSLRDATRQFGTDPNANRSLIAQTGNYKALQAYDKAQVDNQKTQSEIGLNTSHGKEFDSLANLHKTESDIKQHDFHVQELGAITDPSQVPAWLLDGMQRGVLTADQAQAGYKTMQDSLSQPGGFEKWRQGTLAAGTSASDQLKLAQAKQIAADTQANENARNAATNKAHLQGIGMQQAGENSRSAASREAQYKIAGIDPQTGNFVGLGGDGTSGLVDAIGQGKIDPSQAFARMAPGVKAQVIAQVQQKYPDYNPAAYAAAKSTDVNFSQGKNGNSVRSFNVSLEHLDTLGQLADALNNKDTQGINRISNYFSQQTGSPAVTNFNSAKQIVGDEIVKAIVGSGGGVADRDKAQAAIDAANSPAQLKGVISTYKNLMVGQLKGLEGQYKAGTGRDDFQSRFLSDKAKALYSGGSAPKVVNFSDLK